MKYLKMLGLAAVAAAALMAAAGTGTASATVLCHSTSTPCAEEWKAGTEPRFSVSVAGLWTNTSGETIIARCPKGEIRGVITNPGSATETVSTSVEREGFTWPSVEGCIRTVTVAGGSLAIHAIAGTDNGTVTVSGIKITIFDEAFGVSCVYGFGAGGTLGTLTSSGTGKAVLDINTVFVRSEGSFLCPESLRWTEQFTQEAPSGTPLYVEPS
ncbi:MAG: hypothetical protein ACTHNP_13640 [Solirubrobacterales bacterium]